MSLEKAKKILNIVGIITILGSVAAIVLGFYVVLRVGSYGGNVPQVQDSVEFQELAAFFVITGTTLIISGLCALATGVFSVLASRNAKYARTCWILCIVSLVTTVYHGISNLLGSFGWGNLISMLAGLILDSLGFFAANIIKSDYEKQQKRA